MEWQSKHCLHGVCAKGSQLQEGKVNRVQGICAPIHQKYFVDSHELTTSGQVFMKEVQIFWDVVG